MKPADAMYMRLANTYHTALRELQQFAGDEVLMRACGFKTLDDATRYLVSRALTIGENVIRQWEAENPD